MTIKHYRKFNLLSYQLQKAYNTKLVRMKKIDLHIHTISVDGKDSKFEFNFEKLQEYTDKLSLDAIAITNHNLFDLNQFKQIASSLQNTTVFPGIEIDFEDGHLLLIKDQNNLDDFNQKCTLITKEIEGGNQFKIDKLKELFPDLNEYILIPHYDKRPKVKQNIIDNFNGQIFAGEVQSPKKFNRVKKDANSITPLLFGDARISEKLDVEKYQGKQTFIKTDTDTISIDTIKAALMDKNKVFLSSIENNDFFQVFSNGQKLSNGLNVVIGGRSSGKSFLLNKLRDIYDSDEKSVKYIKQFDLVKDDEKEFNKKVEKDKSINREQYLQEFRTVVEDIMILDRRKTDLNLTNYIKTLLEFASSEKLQDEFSNAILFKEVPFAIRPNQRNELENLLRAIILLQKNNEYKIIINKYLPTENLQGLFSDLTNKYKEQALIELKKNWVNDLVLDIRHQLEQKTSSPKIDDNNIDFYQIKLESEKIKRFNSITNSIKQTKTIKEIKIFSKFKIRVVASLYEGAQGLHEECGKQVSFTNAFKAYSSPISFLEEIKNMNSLEKTELYKYFCKVSYQVLNEYDKNVSGGEMAEFNLLGALQDALQYEMLLVDEPESSFDNLFLKDNVNKAIKDISQELPVVVVTHNNTVGMLMNPDYILYTKREIVNDLDEYKIFSGSPGDKEFKTADNKESINSHTVLLDALEAGEDAYSNRGRLYNTYL